MFASVGVYIEEVLNKWKGDYEKLEHNHTYIQWLVTFYLLILCMVGFDINLVSLASFVVNALSLFVGFFP